MYCISVSSQLLSQYWIVRIFVVSFAIVLGIFIQRSSRKRIKKGENLTANKKAYSFVPRFNVLLWCCVVDAFFIRIEICLWTLLFEARNSNSMCIHRNRVKRTIKWIDAIDLVMIRTHHDAHTYSHSHRTQTEQNQQSDTYEINMRGELRNERERATKWEKNRRINTKPKWKAYAHTKCWRCTANEISAHWIRKTHSSDNKSDMVSICWIVFVYVFSVNRY